MPAGVMLQAPQTQRGLFPWISLLDWSRAHRPWRTNVRAVRQSHEKDADTYKIPLR